MRKLFAMLMLCALLCGCAGRAPAATPAPEAATDTPQPTSLQDTAAPETPLSAGSVRVLFINVGRADAILVEAGGRCALIDTGVKEAVPQIFAALAYLGCDAPDMAFLTHTHSDHIGGMEMLALNADIPAAYASVISENKKNGENKITNLCVKVGVPLTRLTAGNTVALSDGAVFEVLGPLVYNADDDNDNSLVLRLAVNGRVLLFTGDMQFAEEESLLKAGVDLAADVLKVGNHGNPDATGDAFAQAVTPSLAVISTDTAVDTDSANARVVAALTGADVRVTQDYPLGVLLTIAPDGTMSVTSPETVHSGASISAELDLGGQTVTLTNTGEQSADLSGFVLYSERGGECFRFPDGAVLAPGGSVTISGEGGAGDYAFAGEAAPWNTKKGDSAVLYDRGGYIVAKS